MQDKPMALVTGANQGIGLQIAKDLVAHGFTVLAKSVKDGAPGRQWRRSGRDQETRA